MIATDGRTDSCDIQCQFCGVTYSMLYNRKDMVDWLSGSKFIQDAMPYLSDNERELFISGTCGDCFTKLFSRVDSEDDDMYNKENEE